MKVFLLLVALSGFPGCYLDSSPSGLDQVVARLTILLKDRDPEVRLTAAEALGKIGQPGGGALLLEALGDPDPGVRGASAWALGRVAVEDVQAGLRLAERLGDSSEAVRQAASLSLGEFERTPVLVEGLLTQLQSADTMTRRAAVLALASLEASAAYSALAAALRDENAIVRQGAVSALGELADDRAIPLLRERLLIDPSTGVRGEAAFRLGKIGDRGASGDVRTAAEKDPDAGVRRWAQWASRQFTASPPGSD